MLLRAVSTLICSVPYLHFDIDEMFLSEKMFTLRKKSQSDAIRRPRARARRPDAAAPPIADGCVSELEKRRAKLSSNGSRPRRQPPTSPSLSAPPSLPPSLPLLLRHHLQHASLQCSPPLTNSSSLSHCSYIPFSYSLPGLALLHCPFRSLRFRHLPLVESLRRQQQSSAVPQHPCHTLFLLSHCLSHSHCDSHPPARCTSSTSLVAPPSTACSHLTAAMANSQLPRAQSASASTSSQLQSAVCWISWTCSTPSTISEDGG